MVPADRLDVEAYARIVASGALDDRRIELLEGSLAEVSPHGPRHAAAIRTLTRHFSSADAWLQVQLPLEIPPSSVPEPDIALLADKPPAGRHPRTALLVVEVAHSSQTVDRVIKAQLYARAGVPVYWLIDIPAEVLEVRSDPQGSGYARLELHRAEDSVHCPVEGVADLDLAELFSELG